MRISVILIIIIAFASCQKPPEPETKGPNCNDTQTKYISPEISNFKFKKGTYWVYIDSISLAIDTMRVDSILSNGLYPYQYCPNNFHEYYSFQVIEKTPSGFSNYNHYVLDESGLKLNPTSENYNTIYYLMESPHERGVIYTGSDCDSRSIGKFYFCT